MWAKTIDEIVDKQHIKATFYTSVGVAPFFNLNEIEKQKDSPGFTSLQRSSYAKNFILNLKKWKPKLMVIACRWNIISDESFKSMEKLVLLSQKLGIKVLIFNQPPQINTMGDRNSAQFLTFLGLYPKNGNQYIKHNSNVEVTNEELKNRFTKYSNTTFLDVYSHFIQEKDHSKSLIIENSDILYYDDDHLSYQGTLLMKKEIEKLIIELISNDK